MIIEADEYDKSFLSLNPYLGLISSVDKDQGDIYKTYKEMLIQTYLPQKRKKI